YPYGQPVKGIAKVSIQLKPYAVYDQGHYIQKVITKELNTENYGVLDLSMSLKDMLKLVAAPSHYYRDWRPINDLRDREILVSAEVTESASGLTLTGNDTMQITDMKYKLSFLATNPANYKPGLYYTGFLQLTQFDGSMPDVRDIANKSCQVVGSYPYAQNTGSRRALTWRDTFAIPRNGLVKFSTLIGDEHTSVSFSVVVTLPPSPIQSFGTHRSANELVERYESVTRKLNVPANDAANAHFWIVPKKLGQISLKILAQSPAAADAVEKKLLVEAEGIEQEYSRVIPLNLNDQTKEIKAEVEITLPSKELVPESTFIYVTVIGDVMGPSINGLERLVRLPHGCGEQNMLNFAPNIYVLQYLEETNQDNSAIKRKCKDYMKTGKSQ
ncbi:hypothetical protein CAPTEDRAFT_218087, partial [Capitella teleta]